MDNLKERVLRALKFVEELDLNSGLAIEAIGRTEHADGCVVISSDGMGVITKKVSEVLMRTAHLKVDGRRVVSYVDGKFVCVCEFKDGSLVDIVLPRVGYRAFNVQVSYHRHLDELVVVGDGGLSHMWEELEPRQRVWKF